MLTWTGRSPWYRRFSREQTYHQAPHPRSSLVVLGSLLFLGCSKATEKNTTGSKKLYVYNWSYYTPDSVVESFEKEFGVDVVLDYFASNEEMFAKLMASGSAGYDVIFPSGDYVTIMKNLNMLEKLDVSKCPTSSTSPFASQGLL